MLRAFLQWQHSTSLSRQIAKRKAEFNWTYSSCWLRDVTAVLAKVAQQSLQDASSAAVACSGVVEVALSEARDETFPSRKVMGLVFSAWGRQAKMASVRRHQVEARQAHAFA